MIFFRQRRDFLVNVALILAKGDPTLPSSGQQSVEAARILSLAASVLKKERTERKLPKIDIGI